MGPKFKVGQRVVYKIPENRQGSVFASMGGDGSRVMHLNAKGEDGLNKPITGTILKVVPDNRGDFDYAFAPDGWITPESGWPNGFMAFETYLTAWKHPGSLPGTITDKSGNPIDNKIDNK